MKIYVGNLPFSATESEIRDLFAQHGTVESVALPTDRETGRPRGGPVRRDGPLHIQGPGQDACADP